MRRKQAVQIVLVLGAPVGFLFVGGGLSAGAAPGAGVGPGEPSARAQPTGTQPGSVLVPGVIRGPSVRVTMPPAGLSLEYPLMANDLGTAACPPTALTAELVRLGSPPLRLGGNSQDLTVPSGALSAPYPSWEQATLYSLPASFWTQLHCLLSTTKDHLTVGINADRGQLAWAQQLVASAQAAATNGFDFALGNEPDLYYLPNYASLGQRRADEVGDVNLYLQVATYLRQTVGSAPLLGPELAIAEDWRHQLPRVIAELHLQMVGVHVYPLSACGNAKSVTIQRLLSVHAADAPEQLGWVVADARAAGVPAIISEANSAACGGRAGVSDSPASAVWAVRFVLAALKTGFREVRFHMSGGPYDAFVVRGARVLSRPLTTALVALHRWLPTGSALGTVRGTPGLVATAVSGVAGGAKLILDNERPRAQTVVLRSAQPVRAEVLSPTRSGLPTEVFPARNGSVRLTVAANTVVAVLSAA